MFVSRILFVYLITVTIPFSTAWAQKKTDDEKKAIESLLTRQDECWNRGDIEGFMQTYWQSEDLTFSSGGQTTRGWQATFDRYKKNYPPEKMGKLNFDGLETTLLSEDVAQVLGNWHLDINGEKKDGNFTLVMKKKDGQWLIVHDHSSTLEKEKGWMTVDQSVAVARAQLQLKDDVKPHVEELEHIVRVSEFQPAIIGPTVYIDRKTGRVSPNNPVEKDE